MVTGPEMADEAVKVVRVPKVVPLHAHLFKNPPPSPTKTLPAGEVVETNQGELRGSVRSGGFLLPRTLTLVPEPFTSEPSLLYLRAKMRPWALLPLKRPWATKVV